MKLTHTIYLATVISAFVICGCGKKCACEAAGGHIQTVKFTSSEIDTVVIRRFEKNSNYQVLHDTALLNSLNTFYVSRGTDTTELATSDSVGLISTNWDYQVYIPATASTFNLSNISELQQRGPCGRCVNPIKGYVVNGQSYSSPLLYVTK